MKFLSASVAALCLVANVSAFPQDDNVPSQMLDNAPATATIDNKPQVASSTDDSMITSTPSATGGADALGGDLDFLGADDPLDINNLEDPTETVTLTGTLSAAVPSATGPCNAPGCQGINNKTTVDGQQFGFCTNGTEGISLCQNSCDADLACNEKNCTGNALDICTEGEMAGCACKNTCPTTMLSCDDKSCNGTSSSQGNGTCEDGDNAGCDCKSICPKQLPKCSDCGGFNMDDGNGICETGKYTGCDCESICPEIGNKQCSDLDDCQPINMASNATCMNGTYSGCSCPSTCPQDPKDYPACDADGCEGMNYVNADGTSLKNVTSSCGGGDLNGCVCTPACPTGDNKFQCQEEKCQGLASSCSNFTSGYFGCPCSGPDATSKPSDNTTALPATTPGVPLPTKRSAPLYPRSGGRYAEKPTYLRWD